MRARERTRRRASQPAHADRRDQKDASASRTQAPPHRRGAQGHPPLMRGKPSGAKSSQKSPAKGEAEGKATPAQARRTWLAKRTSRQNRERRPEQRCRPPNPGGSKKKPPAQARARKARRANPQRKGSTRSTLGSSGKAPSWQNHATKAKTGAPKPEKVMECPPQARQRQKHYLRMAEPLVDKRYHPSVSRDSSWGG